MIEISTDKHILGPFVCNLVHKKWFPDGREVVGVLKDGKPIAGIMFEDYTGPGGSITSHIAIAHPHVPIRKLLVAASMYAYNQLAVDKVFGQVPDHNKEALEFDLRIGFQPVALIEGVYPDGDMFLLVMNREDCKFIPKELRAA